MRRRHKVDIFLVLWITTAVSTISGGLFKDVHKLNDVLHDLKDKIHDSGETPDSVHPLDVYNNDVGGNHHTGHTELHNDLPGGNHHTEHIELHNDLHKTLHSDLDAKLHDDIGNIGHHTDLPHVVHHLNVHNHDIHHHGVHHHSVHHHGKDRLHELHIKIPNIFHDPKCRHHADSEPFNNPSNCSQFHRCAYGKFYTFACPKGLMFSTNTTRCEYPEDANCTDNIVREKTCKMGELFANPHNCSAFYECVLNGEKKLMSCPEHLKWCDRLKRCEYPATAKCIEIPGPIDGGWTNYGQWSPCTATCGHGFQVRRRNCTNPRPARGGSECIGKDYDTRECPNISECEELSDKDRVRWTEWGDCSVTCGHGTRVRNRKCISQRTHKLLGDYSNCNENEFESQECPHLPVCGAPFDPDLFNF